MARLDMTEKEKFKELMLSVSKTTPNIGIDLFFNRAFGKVLTVNDLVCFKNDPKLSHSEDTKLGIIRLNEALVKEKRIVVKIEIDGLLLKGKVIEYNNLNLNSFKSLNTFFNEHSDLNTFLSEVELASI